jgi:flagellin-like protein
LVDETARKGTNLIKLNILQLRNKVDFFLKRRKGISPILATVIIFALILTGVMVTFIQVIPYIEQAQSEEAISSIRNSFVDLDNTIKSLISESGTPGGFRTVLLSKSAGKIDFDSSRHEISLRLIDGNTKKLVYGIFDEQEIAVLDWEYNSPRSVLPRGTTQYLTGPNPFEKREQVFITGPFATTNYQDLTNLTLSHRYDRRHHIMLNYRISIYISILTQPSPEIRIQIYLILLKADFETLFSNYKQLTVHSSQNFSTPYSLSEEEISEVAVMEVQWQNRPPFGRNTTLWSTSDIQGLSQVSFFNIVVQTSIYEISLNTS